MGSPLWEWVDTILGLIAGILSAIVGLTKWLNPKFARLETMTQELRNDTDERIHTVHERITVHIEEISRLRAHREDDRKQLERIDTKLDRILERMAHDQRSR